MEENNQPSPYFIRRVTPVDSDAIDVTARRFQTEEDRGLDLLRYWVTVRKHRWLISAVAAVVTIFVGVRVSMMTPLYTTEATIVVKPGVPDLLRREGDQGNSPNSDAQPDDGVDFIKTQLEILRSRNLAANVIRQEGLANDPAFLGPKPSIGLITSIEISIAHWVKRVLDVKPKPRPKEQIILDVGGVNSGLVGQYLGSLELKEVPDTDLIRIVFTTANPELSAKLANAHARAYIRMGIDLHTQANAEAEIFLKEKLVELKARLRVSEIALNDYRRAKGIIPGLMSMDGKETVVLDRLTDLSKELTAAQVARIGLEAQVEQIKSHRFSENSVENKSGSVDNNLSSQLSELDAEYAAMSRQFKPDYPPLARLMAKRNQLMQSMVEGVEGSYRAAKIKEGDLQTAMDKERLNALTLNDDAVEYTIRQREVDTNRELYNGVLQRMKDVGLAAESQTSNVVILDLAEVPGGPSSPHIRTAIMQALAFGLALGIGLAFLIDYQDKTLKTPDEVESYLGLPSLAAVPAFSRVMQPAVLPKGSLNGTAKLKGRSLKEIDDSFAHRLPEEIAGSLRRYSVIGEAFRGLRTALMLSRAGSPPKTILFTSSTKGEGKTVAAMNTAVVFAYTGARVLLVDADLRRPRTHKLLGLENRNGITEVLAGSCRAEDVIQNTQINGLSLMTAGSPPPNPSELVGSDKMRQTLETLASQFDIVVVDSPPLMPVTDAMLLSTMVDGVVLVVNSAKTSKQHVKAGCNRLDFARARIFGVLLNEVDVQSPHYKHYRLYYGDYHSSYESHDGNGFEYSESEESANGARGAEES